MKVIRKPIKISAMPEENTALLTVGDIHGCYDLLVALLDIAQDIAPETPQQTKLVLLGDQIDRGPESVKVLNLLKNGVADWEIIPLLGNHEQLLLNVLAANEDSFKMRWMLWRGNGGGALLDKAGLDWSDLAPLSLTQQKNQLINAIGPAYIDFIQDFPSHYVNGDFLCVHAGIHPHKTIQENFAQERLSQDPDHWAWIRDPFLNHKGPYPDHKFIVHGHTILPGPKLQEHRIGLDTGACLTGVLSAALFFKNEMTIFQVTPD